ncbi:MAG: helix-turn-helix transcriptional regulator [Pseudomonadota bacterium]
MNNAVSLTGEPFIVMTKAEYDELTEDIADSALAADAMQDHGDAPFLLSEHLTAMHEEGLHPLAAWRKSVGLTQAELAEKAGVRAASVSDIEGRKLDPRLSTLKAIANALKLGVDDIIE